MDPVTATTAITAAANTFEQLNRVGGIVAVLLGIQVAIFAVAIVLGVKAFRHISKRLGDTEDSRVHLLTGCIQKNTETMTEVKSEIRIQTNTINQQTEAMRTRPCLVESGVHHRTPLPQVRTT